MQPNTVNTHHQTNPPARAPVPAELLETVARALAAALVPLPRQPAARCGPGACARRGASVTGPSRPPTRAGTPKS